jgi:iron(III) transport system permease protein
MMIVRISHDAVTRPHAALLTLLCLVLALPVLGVLAPGRAGTRPRWRCCSTSCRPCCRSTRCSRCCWAGVGVGVTLLGSATAAAVVAVRLSAAAPFRVGLLLPLAMPAYVLAYAWTDALQYSGPLQARCARPSGCAARCGPTIRSFGGAVVLFVLCLYPYVYLLVRAS